MARRLSARKVAIPIDQVVEVMRAMIGHRGGRGPHWNAGANSGRGTYRRMIRNSASIWTANPAMPNSSTA